MNPEELKHIAVLQGIDGDALTRLAAALEEKNYADGEAIFAEGDPGDSMYFIVSGRARIEKRAQSVHKVLTTLEAGDYFGEMALLDQKPRSAAAIASGQTRALRLSKADFDALQNQSSLAGMSVLFAMIRTSSERIRRLSAHMIVYDEVGRAIGETRDLQSLLDVILQQLASATGANWGLLVLRSQFSENLEVRSLVNLVLTAPQKDAVSAGQGFLGAILQNPQDEILANIEQDARFNSGARLGFETTSLLVSPITQENKLLGLVLLGGGAPKQFGLDALNLCRGVARQTAQAILNARHREEEAARSRHSRQYVRF
jgi:CRP/FNR family transcriptional regulator, cyclic AMP receptor protein